MTGLVGWWPLHRTVGDAIDLSGEGNHGTIAGATRGVAGRGGLQAFSFDGVDDILRASGTALDLTDPPWSVFCWLKRRSNYGGLDRWSGQTPGDQSYQTGMITFEFSSSGTGGTTDALHVNVGGSFQTTVGSTPIDDSDWYHIGFTYDGTTYTAWVNGSSDGTVANSSAPSNVSTDPISFAGAYGDFVDCAVTDARVYDRALSATEIERLYDWGGGDYAQPPSDLLDADAVSYWPLDESSGDAIDQWGSNDGTVTGATQGVQGVRDTAYSFDGTDDYVNVDGAFPDTQSFTVSLWALPPDPGSVSDIRLFGHDGTRVWLGDRNGSTDTNESRWNLNVYDGANYVTVSGSSTSGSWVNFLCMYDGSTVSLYENAVLKGSTSLASRGDTGTADFTIGRGAPAGSHYPGDLDEIRVYSRALSPAEIHEVYQYGTFGRDLRKKTVNAR